MMAILLEHGGLQAQLMDNFNILLVSLLIHQVMSLSLTLPIIEFKNFNYPILVQLALLKLFWVFVLLRNGVLRSTADGQFSSPVDVALDTSGNMFVVDNDNFRIQKFVDDTIPPTVTITSPPNESTFIAPATETINVGATDNLGIKQVEPLYE